VRVLDEFLNRRAAGEAVDEETLLASHPDCADELREHLELLRHLQPRKQRIAELLTRGILQPAGDGACSALLGDYQVHGVLGEGGMGVVLDGYDPRLNRRVALKVLRPELAGDATALARFEREAKAAGALQHPNVLTIHGVGGERGAHYIIMERVDGPSLAQLLRTRGPLPAALTRDVFAQIIEGLAAAHEAGLIHRGIKSSNILLTHWPGDPESGLEDDQPVPGSGDGRAGDATQHLAHPRPIVKIADFGLARMRSSQTQLTLGNSVLGTPEYMSPEQARGVENVDHRTDLYSAGVVLYEMLTGRTPFRADTPTATIHRILHDRPQDPRQIERNTDPVLASLALRLMAKQPEDRLASAEEALSVLAARRCVRVVRRWCGHRVVLGLGVILALSAAGGLAMLWPSGGASDDGMRYWNGHYYLLVPDWVGSWTAAREAASARTSRGLQGRLATIESRSENEFLAREVSKVGTDCYWIGGHQPEAGASPTDGWLWITGEPFGYTNWDVERDQPDDFGGNENCLEFHRDGTWNDLADYWGTQDNTAAGRGYIVEFAP